MTPQSRVEQVFVNTADRVRNSSRPVFVGSQLHGSLMIYNDGATTLTCPIGADGSVGNMSLSKKLDDDVVATLDSSGSMTLRAKNRFLSVDRFEDTEVFETVLEAFDPVTTTNEEV